MIFNKVAGKEWSILSESLLSMSKSFRIDSNLSEKAQCSNEGFVTFPNDDYEELESLIDFTLDSLDPLLEEFSGICLTLVGPIIYCTLDGKNEDLLCWTEGRVSE